MGPSYPVPYCFAIRKLGGSSLLVGKNPTIAAPSRPAVQELEARSQIIKLYTNVPMTPTKTNSTEDSSIEWGSRDALDTAPFTLFNAPTRSFRSPLPHELFWIMSTYRHSKIGSTSWYIWVSTYTPPEPRPLTLGCMPVVFCKPGEEPNEYVPTSMRIFGAHPNKSDPRSSLRWERMTFPSKELDNVVREVLRKKANVQRVFYMPNFILVELNHTDGRYYGSLPGFIMGRTTLYHHQKESVVEFMMENGYANQPYYFGSFDLLEDGCGLVIESD